MGPSAGGTLLSSVGGLVDFDGDGGLYTAPANAAIREGLLRDNPARYVELPTPGRPQAQVWTEHRAREWRTTGARFSVAVWTASLLAEFLRFVAEDRLYAMWWLIALRGLRRVRRPGCGGSTLTWTSGSC
ncbi:MAG: hypothetical protein QOE61_4379 [Micromonosporaceae bacterium]|jgi:hypothetical protein|nr:hypothetical protein [Micromonosporaceae bacterium]